MSGSDWVKTPNYGLFKPVPNADIDAWGGHLNANADTLDTVIKQIETAVPVPVPPVWFGQTPPVGGYLLWWDPVGGQLYVHYDDGNSQQWVAASNLQGLVDLAPAMHNVGRNLIHNPLFNVAQRGAGPFTTFGYTVDRWALGMANCAGSSLSQSPVSEAQRGQIGDEAAQNMLGATVVGTAAAGDYFQAFQRIENVRRLSGKTVTVSFYASGTAGIKVGACFIVNYGTGGSPTPANTTIPGQAITLTTPMSRYSVTFTLPTASGVTFGTAAGTDFTQLEFWFSAGSTLAARSGGIGQQSGTVQLWGVQLEVGSVATPLEKPDPQQELAKCQRFYQVGSVASYGMYVGGGAFTVGGIYSLPATMRATPVMAITSTPTLTNCTAPTATGSTAAAFSLTFTGTATGAANMSCTYTASADL